MAFLLGFFSLFNPMILDAGNMLFLLMFLKLIFSFYFIVRFKIKSLDFESMLLVFGVFLIVFHSLIFSLYPALSTIKAAVYLVILLGFYAAFSGTRTVDIISSLRILAIGFLLASLLVLPFPDVGYARDQMGFQGITAHPQIFGILAGLALLVFLDCILQSSVDKIRLFYMVCFLLMVTLLLLSRARTGIIVFAAPVFLHALLERHFILKKGMLYFIFSSFVCSVLLLYFGFVDFSFFVEFFYKGDNSNVSEAFESSRGFLLAESIYNLMRHPLTGLGFGVADSVFKPFVPVYDSYFGIPISAPTEKANIVIGILEELGYIIGLVVLLTHFLFLRRVFSYSSRILSLLCIGCYVSGISEFVFYSVNSLGYIYALLLIVTIRTIKNDRSPVYK
jgi:hypothetical protein